jgi:hypothetical protein
MMASQDGRRVQCFCNHWEIEIKAIHTCIAVRRRQHCFGKAVKVWNLLLEED